MKIAYFVPKIENCGPVNVVLNIIKEISSNPNISIILISLRKENNTKEDYSLVFKENGVKEIIYLNDCRTPFHKLSFLNKTLSDTDVIHSHGFFPDLYSSLVSKKLYKVTTAHCIFLKDYQFTYGILKGAIVSSLHHLVYLNPSLNHIVGCSKEISRYLKLTNFINRHKISAIQNGVNTNTYKKLDFQVKLDKRETLLDELNIINNTNTSIFIYSGSLTRRKRVPELIEWFKKLPHKDNILIILGDGVEIELCKEISKNENNIFLLGFVDNALHYYQLADYIVSNSSLEGFPMSILEGMACGCKALLSDIPAHKEVIKQFPNLAMTLNNFPQFSFDSKPTNKEFFHLSAARMANQYLALYRKSFSNRSS